MVRLCIRCDPVPGKQDEFDRFLAQQKRDYWLRREPPIPDHDNSPGSYAARCKDRAECMMRSARFRIWVPALLCPCALSPMMGRYGAGARQ